MKTAIAIRRFARFENRRRSNRIVCRLILVQIAKPLLRIADFTSLLSIASRGTIAVLFQNRENYRSAKRRPKSFKEAVLEKFRCRMKGINLHQFIHLKYIIIFRPREEICLINIM